MALTQAWRYGEKIFDARKRDASYSRGLEGNKAARGRITARVEDVIAHKGNIDSMANLSEVHGKVARWIE